MSETGNTRTIAGMPAELRPYEKCEALGAEYLSDPELLAVIIRTGTCNMSSVGLAEQLLYSRGRGFGFLMNATMEELKAFKGIGRVKAIQLRCLGELCRRIWREKRTDAQEVFSAAESAAAYYMQALRGLSEEEVHLMLLDTRCRMIRSVLVSRGTVNASALSPREIFTQALACRAASFYMVHNHPSGIPEPSPEDIMFSRLVARLGKMMNLPMRDSIVIGDNDYVSLYEKKLLEPEDINRMTD